MKTNHLLIVLIFFCLQGLVWPLYAQTKYLSLANGPGWYRIIASNAQTADGTIRLYGGMGNNRITLLSMDVALMRYGQGGSINITENLYYNNNHIDSIRAGSVASLETIVDIYVSSIVNPTTLTVTVEGSGLTIPNTAVFSPAPPTGTIIGISGKVVGIQSTTWPVYFSKKVGIGTSVIPAGYTLAVNGKGIMEELLIKQPGQWPDYIFADDYKLPDLEETEAFIKKNRHLPGMPSAAEVEKQGVSLGEMNRKLLEKVEELTLMIMEQNKRIRALESKD